MIKKRKFFYISGFDPRGYRTYREVLKGAVQNYDILYDAKTKITPHKNGLVLENGDISCDYTFLAWDDIIRKYWIKNPFLLALKTITAYIIYALNIRWSLVSNLPRGPVITLFFPILSLLFFIAFFTIFFATPLLFFSTPFAWLLGVCLSLPVAAVICQKIKSLWLLYFFIFNAESFTKNASILDSHYNAFAKQIKAALEDQNYDEVICAAHSNGSILMIPLLEHLITIYPELDFNKFKILTLGQCIPLASYLRHAKEFHKKIETVKQHPFIWCDLSSPADGVCFALHNVFNPYEGTEKTNMILKSPQFHKYYSADDYRKMRRNKFKMHFAYLETPPKKSPFGFVSLLLSRQPLEDILNNEAK